jgi:hypothetical protein
MIEAGKKTFGENRKYPSSLSLILRISSTSSFSQEEEEEKKRTFRENGRYLSRFSRPDPHEQRRTA